MPLTLKMELFLKNHPLIEVLNQIQQVIKKLGVVEKRNRESHNKKCFWKGAKYKSIRECSRKENIPFSTVQKYLNWNKIQNCYLL